MLPFVPILIYRPKAPEVFILAIVHFNEIIFVFILSFIQANESLSIFFPPKAYNNTIIIRKFPLPSIDVGAFNVWAS